MTDVLEFSHRNNLFSKPSSLRLDETSLAEVVDGVTMEQIALSRIDEVRLKFAPIRSQPNRYECCLTVAGHKDIAFSNIYFAGAFDQQDKSALYVPFVRTLLQRIAQANPQARFVAGMTTVGYYASTGFFLLIMALFAALLFIVPFGKLSTTSILKIVLVLLFVPSLIRHIRVSKPRSFQPNEPPPELLPTAKA